MKVATILESKGSSVVTVSPESSTTSVVGRMKLEQIGSVVVSRRGNDLLGMVSERDVVHGLSRHGDRLMSMAAEDYMSAPMPTCTPEDSLTKVMVEMTQHRRRHLPVLDAGLLAGIVSIGDVVKHRLDELKMEADLLRDLYLAGR